MKKHRNETLTIREAIAKLQTWNFGTAGDTKLTVWTGPRLYGVKDITLRAGKDGSNRVTVILADEPFFDLEAKR